MLGDPLLRAFELFVRRHGPALRARAPEAEPAAVHQAASRIVARLAVILCAEECGLLPRDHPLYRGAYSLTGLLEELGASAPADAGRLARSWNAWPRVLALFRLLHQGSRHPGLPVPACGGGLFAPGSLGEAAPAGHATPHRGGAAAHDPDGATTAGRAARALAVFERACFERNVLSDHDVRGLLEALARARASLGATAAAAEDGAGGLSPRDGVTAFFGTLQEWLLDTELRIAPPDDPVIELALPGRPCFALTRLEGLDAAAVATLLELSVGGARRGVTVRRRPATGAGERGSTEPGVAGAPAEDAGARLRAARIRAEWWARRALESAADAPGRPAAELILEARRLIARVIPPGEWYLAPSSRARKGSGTFYTPPALARGTVAHALRPLAYGGAGATAEPRPPEDLLALRVCDPACGTGVFLVAALRFLAEALEASLRLHGRIRPDGDGANVQLPCTSSAADAAGRPPGAEPAVRLSCRPDDPAFPARLRPMLLRAVARSAIHGVDVDPLAVELCRAALWLEIADPALPLSGFDARIRCGDALVGAWLDTFRHYPAMAWKRRGGGDSGHEHGVHFRRDARGSALRAFAREVLAPDLAATIAGADRPPSLFDQAGAEEERDAEAASGPPARREAMDLWCACWFWPAAELEHAPLPSGFAAPAARTSAIARRLAAEHRFFHWEIEFPDVFASEGSGFDAILGNPPWETLQPNSREYFSALDPLFLAGGKQEGLRRQGSCFADAAVERAWLDAAARYADLSNWVRHAAAPFGDPAEASRSAEAFPLARGGRNGRLHAAWRAARADGGGRADPAHPFRHQGDGKAYTYKLFLEMAHALLRPGGRIGFLVPSGLHSDLGAAGLRRLLLERCRWEWLYGFENRDEIFGIHRSYKFSAVVVEKGGATESVRAAFMRRRVEEWDDPSPPCTRYARAAIERLSPRARTLLEVASDRDLEVLARIYARSVRLGDGDRPGRALRLAQGDLNLTSASRRFPPRAWWEAAGYRPDEYSRWLRGDWRPIEELWSALRIHPGRPAPLEPGCDARLRCPDVATTPWRLRCAQPPYDALPVPRADLPADIVLSRAADAWIREDRIEDAAVPLWQGAMLYDLSPWAAGFRSGAGHRARWERREGFLDEADPQFLLGAGDLPAGKPAQTIAYRIQTNATNERSFVCALLDGAPCGNSIGLLELDGSLDEHLLGLLVGGSFVFDWVVRRRMAGTNVNGFFLADCPWPVLPEPAEALLTMSAAVCRPLALTGRRFAPLALAAGGGGGSAWREAWAATPGERARRGALADAVAAALYGLSGDDLRHILRGCDRPAAVLSGPAARDLDPRGFWRVDRTVEPARRRTVLALEAFAGLEAEIRNAAGDLSRALAAWLGRVHGPGGVADRLPVAGRPPRSPERPLAERPEARFLDWQVAQLPEESWRECRLHARHLQAVPSGTGARRRRGPLRNYPAEPSPR